MLVVAGPVFTEWYWGPIFFALFFGPPITAVAALLYVGVPRRYRRRVPGGRPVRVIAAYLLAAGLVVGGWAAVRAYRFQRVETAQARALGFPLFQPRDGAGFDVTRAEVYDSVRGSLQTTVERGDSSFFASQHALGAADLSPPECAAGGAHVTRGGGFEDEPCAAATTPAGRAVALAREAGMPYDRYLFADLGGTLLALSTLDTPRVDLLAYVDALEPVPPDAIDYEP